jgi:hypothetical protein
MNDFSGKEINKAQDGFKKYCDSNKISQKRDTIFNKSSSAGKGDVPRNISDSFKSNFEEIFPNSFKPYWKK